MTRNCKQTQRKKHLITVITTTSRVRNCFPTEYKRHGIYNNIVNALTAAAACRVFFIEEPFVSFILWLFDIIDSLISSAQNTTSFSRAPPFITKLSLFVVSRKAKVAGLSQSRASLVAISGLFSAKRTERTERYCT